MNVDHPRQPSASIALTVLEEKKKTKTVKIVADVIDVKYIEAVSDLDGDRLCIDTEVASDTESDDNSSHIGDGDMLVMPDLGDELVIAPHMSDSDNEESKDMGDELIIDFELHGDRLELPSPVRQPVLHTTIACHHQSSVQVYMHGSHQYQAVYQRQSMSTMHHTMIVHHQPSTAMQSYVRVETESVIKFKKLASHLGGLSFDYNTYRVTFGDITDERPYGTHVWRGMVQKVGDYPFKQKVWGIHPWFCYFITPEKFSKSTAATPVSTLVNRGTDFNTDNSYPAIVFLTDAQHSYLMSMAACCRRTKNISDGDFFDGLQFDGRSAIDSSTIVRASPGISTVVRYDPMVISEVDMCCLKILIIGCRPWRVHSSWLQLYMPVAYAKL
jgi:hypothetical protein